MRATAVRLVRQRRPERNVAPLLPPLKLYREILRTHIHKLPPDLRFLGDQYVKAEFKAHQKIDNPLHIVGFLSQWQDYLRELDSESWVNGKLSKTDFEKMTDEQVNQLYELMQETKRLNNEA